MSITIALEKEEEERLRALAKCEQCAAEDLCRRAVISYLRERESPAENGADPYTHLRRMVGLAGAGPSDSSVRHDPRPGE